MTPGLTWKWKKNPCLKRFVCSDAFEFKLAATGECELHWTRECRKPLPSSTLPELTTGKLSGNILSNRIQFYTITYESQDTKPRAGTHSAAQSLLGYRCYLLRATAGKIQSGLWLHATSSRVSTDDGLAWPAAWLAWLPDCLTDG